MDAGQTLLVSFISAVAGYLLSIWRSRLQPWITILAFSESRRFSDRVSVNKNVIDASRESWFMYPLSQNEVEMEDLYRAVSSAKHWIDINSDTEQVIRESIKELEKAQGQIEIMKALEPFLMHTGASDLIELAILRKVIIPQYNIADTEYLTYYLDSKKRNGCYMVVFTDSYYSVGNDFNDEKFKLDGLIPLINLLIRLDKDNLLKALRQLEPLYKKQLENHNKIKIEAENTLQENSHWTCALSISNFGSTPFLVFPNEAKLIIQGKQIKKFELDCKILVQDHDENSPGWAESQGVIILKPSYSETYSIVTEKTQKNIGSGKLLRQVFENGDADAHVEIKILGREIPWKQKVKSASLVFSKR